MAFTNKAEKGAVQRGIGPYKAVSLRDKGAVQSGSKVSSALSSYAGSFNIDTTKTATQTQSITGVGFQPKIVLFFWGGSTGTGDTVAGGSYNLGFGAAISSSSRFCLMTSSYDAQAATRSDFSHQTTEIVRAYSAYGTLDGILDFSSMDADGFTVVVDDQFTQAYRISYLALGGTDLTNVYIGSATTSASVGNYDVTAVGFQPDALITITREQASTGAGGGYGFSLGMATGSSAQGVISPTAEFNVGTTATSGYGYNGETLASVASSNAVYHRESFVSFLENGFRLNHLESASTILYSYICLKGGSYLVGDLTTRTDGNDISETVGFQPLALLFGSVNRALSTQDTGTDQARASIGAATSTSNRACAAISDEDNLADSETAYANYDSAVYANIADDAIVGLMDLKSVESDGFTCVMDDTDPSACWVTYLAIGAAGAEPSASESPSESPSISPSVSESPSLSPSLSPSISESPSLSPSLSPSVSISPSLSPSVSVSPSISPSVSASPSLSPSISESPSESVSVSPSLSPSVSISPSESPSESPSLSPSLSPSVSISPSISPSESVSESPSESVSESPSESISISPSISPSLSPSVSESPSVSPSQPQSLLQLLFAEQMRVMSE